jgi:hypothetical protein
VRGPSEQAAIAGKELSSKGLRAAPLKSQSRIVFGNVATRFVLPSTSKAAAGPSPGPPDADPVIGPRFSLADTLRVAALTLPRARWSMDDIVRWTVQVLSIIEPHRIPPGVTKENLTRAAAKVLLSYPSKSLTAPEKAHFRSMNTRANRYYLNDPAAERARLSPEVLSWVDSSREVWEDRLSEFPYVELPEDLPPPPSRDGTASASPRSITLRSVDATPLVEATQSEETQPAAPIRSEEPSPLAPKRPRSEPSPWSDSEPEEVEDEDAKRAKLES